MAFQPSDTLKSRTFLGLIIAQFLAAFNDQCIHASAMFYAIHQEFMTEATAISLMPVLFYAPWGIFCTLAGYLADRYSKRNSLIAWKIAEIAITLVALAGFWLGTVHHHHNLGPAIVLSTVFLMGTHSAFFVPAKYGAMPEILQPQSLSKGNGILESTSFLAVILGTVTGGILSDERVFKGQEYYIGAILFGLAVIGALASFLIQRMPAANPQRAFPTSLVKPLADNLRIMIRSRPLALAILGIAFFTFMVAFMRGTIYMHGETRNPRWTELHTSMVVATVALGVGLGSPLAGILSGGKVELGLVPLGSVGMILVTAVAGYAIFFDPSLIVALVMIGFFSGFYIVPLYTLLQHRAPKTSKGDLIATSNFINVTGAMAASLLFFGLVFIAHRTGIAPEVEQVDVARGELLQLRYARGRPVAFRVQKTPGSSEELKISQRREGAEKVRIEEADSRDGLIDLLGSDLKPRGEDKGSDVIVSRYTLVREGQPVDHYRLRRADKPQTAAYDDEQLPRYLFLGASAMTLGVLLLLCRQLPDFFVRSLLWLRSHGRYRLKVVGQSNLPSNGAVILATNCDRFHSCMQVLAATDRFTRFVLFETLVGDEEWRPLLRFLAHRTGLIVLRPQTINRTSWAKALAKACKALDNDHLLGVTIDSPDLNRETEDFLDDLLQRRKAPLLPVYCDTVEAEGALTHPRRVRVVIGPPLPADTAVAVVRQTIRAMGDWLQQAERTGTVPATVLIPGASGASPTTPALDLQSPP
jgi:MFS family permease